MCGKFIVVEGIDGAGKTTAVRYIESYAHKHALPIVVTKEPSEIGLGEYIRDILASNTPYSSRVLAGLFAANRYEHLRYLILPSLVDGANVVCDRYIWSSFAYQGVSEADLDFIEYLHQVWYEPPDHALYLYTDVATALRRVEGRTTQARTLFEQDKFLSGVLRRYGETLYTKRRGFGPNTELYVIDATGTVESVQQALEVLLPKIFASGN
jgi:dTMP kinase